MNTNRTKARLIQEVCFKQHMCYGFEEQVWGMRITFSRRLGTAGLFIFLGMQKTRRPSKSKGF